MDSNESHEAENEDMLDREEGGQLSEDGRLAELGYSGQGCGCQDVYRTKVVDRQLEIGLP